MRDDKGELAKAFFSQVETQVQFGDTKASLVVTGNAILLGLLFFAVTALAAAFRLVQ